MSERLVDRVRKLLRHSEPVVAHDEHTASRNLGYTRRSDHPWLNQQRPTVASKPGGALGELEFGAGKDFTR